MQKKKSTDISGWPERRIPQDFPTLRCASQTHLSGLSESYRAKKAKRFKTRAMDRGLNSLGGILQKESDHCPFLWSSSLLPNLKAAGSEPQPRDKGLFFFWLKEVTVITMGQNRREVLRLERVTELQSVRISALGYVLILQGVMQYLHQACIRDYETTPGLSGNSQTSRRLAHFAHCFLKKIWLFQNII